MTGSAITNRARRYWRTAAAAAVMGGVGLGQVITSATATAQPAASTWVPGNAVATSQAFTVGPSQGGLSYAFTFGFSVADYEGSEGYAQSKTFDGGAAITATQVQECPGSSPDLEQSPPNQPNNLAAKDYLPNPVIVEAPSTTGGNETGAMSLTSSYAQGATVPGTSAGSEQGTATTQPSGDAVSKIAQFGLPGVFDISGAQSSASAEQVTGQLRQAESTADVAEVDLGGIVDLKGLHWQDEQETGPSGAVTAQTASFSLASLSVHGIAVPVPADDLTQLTTVINTALSGEGIHVTLPTAVTQQNGEEDLGPLSIGLNSSALLTQALGPAWTTANNGAFGLPGYGATTNGILQDQNPDTGQPLIATGNPKTDADVAEALCQLNTPTAVASILAAVLTGSGSLNLNLGGTTALSQGIAYADPFGSVGNGQGNTVSVGSGNPADLGSGGFSPGSPATPALPGTLGTPGSPGTAAPTAGAGPTTTTQPAAARQIGLVRTAQRCVLSCRGGGAALPVGLAGLAAVAGTGLADFRKSRRNRRFHVSAPTQD